MIAKILYAGSGGQGVLTMGNVFGNAAMLENLFVTYIPSYGAAMRGGTANCTISVSDVEIASPVASAPDIVIAMNQPSAVTFLNRLQPGGQMIYNSNLVDSIPFRGDVDVYPVPASDIAAELGNNRSANMVLLGAFLKLTNLVKVEAMNKSVEILMGSKKKLVEISIKAIAAGYERFPFETDED
ncbi:MAG: 2-oxoacid:ferredoxin oxidoreductase subunit gamma [bacterium]|nr:2-oxoacid:ferredoxin oxidoreductase subunit gamma [bacterium]